MYFTWNGVEDVISSIRAGHIDRESIASESDVRGR